MKRHLLPCRLLVADGGDVMKWRGSVDGDPAHVDKMWVCVCMCMEVVSICADGMKCVLCVCTLSVLFE